MGKTAHRAFDCAEGCSVEAALAVIGGKWKGTILYRLHRDGVLRFNEIRRILPAVSHHRTYRLCRSAAARGIPPQRIRSNPRPRAGGVESVGRRALAAGEVNNLLLRSLCNNIFRLPWRMM